MSENGAKSLRLSVHVLLPEALDRRFARRTEKMPGASWPTWGGHVTLVPNFIPLGSEEAVLAVLQEVCAQEEALTLRFGAPIAVPDVTRQGYFALLLQIESVEETVGKGAENRQTAQDDAKSAPTLIENLAMDGAQPQPARASRLAALRRRLLDALAPLREDLHPQLVAQPFMPHVTLALGIGEAEAHMLVRKLRADPVVAEFAVEAIWLLKQTLGETPRVDRQPVPLGRFAAPKPPVA